MNPDHDHSREPHGGDPVRGSTRFYEVKRYRRIVRPLLKAPIIASVAYLPDQHSHTQTSRSSQRLDRRRSWCVSGVRVIARESARKSFNVDGVFPYERLKAEG